MSLYSYNVFLWVIQNYIYLVEEVTLLNQNPLEIQMETNG